MQTIEQDVDDIASFADPYTEWKSKRTKDAIRLDMIRGGRQLQIDLKDSGRVSEVSGRKATFASVDSYIASDRLANLLAFAGTQLRAASSVDMPSTPIPSLVRVDGKNFRGEELGAKISRNDSNKLRLVLLNGPAGVGKTFQIKALAKDHALRHTKGEVVPPVLLVSSQGRRLSNLRDVLAATTQELETAFSARHVPMLVRRGLLVVAVDGFDELVDADGYEDSWRALRQFIAEVGQPGVMLLAARDTFVEDQELLERIQRTRREVNLAIADVLPPTPEQARSWLQASPNWKPSELESDIARDMLNEGSYALRPFFLRELWSAKGWTDVVDAGPRTYLVNRVLTREAKLIARQLGMINQQEIADLLFGLMQEVALEMATREVDSVEVDHVAFLIQFFFEGLLDELAVRKLAHKAGSLALLELTRDKSSRKFSHSEIRHYFFGVAILRQLATGTVPALLRRHFINAEQGEVLAEVMTVNAAEARKAIKECSSLMSSEVASDNLAPNLAAILFVGLSLGYVDRIDFAELIEATFAGQSPKGVITKSRVSRLDARGADLSRLVFENVQVDTLVTDGGTVIGASLPELGSVEIRGELSDRTLHAADEISAWVEEQRFSGVDGDSPRVQLLQKIARRAVRHFYLRATGDQDDGSVLLADPLWPDVLKVLQRNSRVDVHRARPMHGRPSPLIRVKNPLALLDPANKDTSKIFSELQLLDRAVH